MYSFQRYTHHTSGWRVAPLGFKRFWVFAFILLLITLLGWCSSRSLWPSWLGTRRWKRSNTLKLHFVLRLIYWVGKLGFGWLSSVDLSHKLNYRFKEKSTHWWRFVSLRLLYSCSALFKPVYMCVFKSSYVCVLGCCVVCVSNLFVLVVPIGCNLDSLQAMQLRGLL